MSNYVPDNYDLFRMHEAEQERQLAKLPRCCSCDSPITDEYGYKIEGDLLCWNCAEEWLREQAVDIDELIEKGW